MSDEKLRKRAASDPLRLRILELMGYRDGWTAKQLAQELGVGANGLYYHLRLLEEVGLIAVVGTQAVGRMVERVYGRAPEQRYKWDIREPLEMVIHLGAILEAAKARAEDALFDMARRADQGERPPGYITFNAPSFVTSQEQIEELAQQVWDLQMQFRKRAADLREQAGGDIPSNWKRMRFTYVLHDEPIRDYSASPSDEGPPTGAAVP